MEKPLVSVIVPVYNTELFIERTIQSLLEQTYSNIEIILVDDGSTDSSGEICDSFARNHERIKVYHNVNNGVSYTRNYGLHVAHGEYVHFVDSDDKLPNDFVEKMLHNMISNDSDVVFCGLARVFEYQEFLIRLEDRTYSIDDYFVQLYKGDRFTTTSSCIGMYKMQIIRDYGIRFPEELRCGEDAVFVIDYMKHAKKISSIKDTVYYYMYDNEKSATKCIFYDHYQLEQKRYDKIKNIVTENESLKKISFYYMDKIIRELVIYAQFSPDSSKEIKKMLRCFIMDENTKFAILNYYRNSPTKSFWIPVAIKYRMTSFLYFLLIKRKTRMNREQARKSIWR